MNVSSTAFVWGCISAVSLPLGAILGLWLKPAQKVTSLLMAFGAGALLFALTIELFAHSLHESLSGKDHIIIFSTIGGALLGGLVFELLNQILCNNGAFFRKISLFKSHIHKQKKMNAEHLIEGLSKVRFIQLLPAEEIAHLIPFVKTKHFMPGETIFKQGDVGDELYFIIEGSAKVTRTTKSNNQNIATLSTGDTFGEIALISNNDRTATVQAVDELETYTIQKSDFEYLLRQSSDLNLACKKLVDERLENISGKDESFRLVAQEWKDKAQSNLELFALPITSKDYETEITQHKGNPALAIWLGIALDAIPESLVIGMLVAAAIAANQPMSLAFIAGVFLANLPEAMSSSVTMEKQGIKWTKIFWMWMSLCIMTGLGAMLGSVAFPPDAHGSIRYLIAGIEGMAAGAMLTMIANTMLPEAFEHGGSTIAGLSTLVGFIAALCMKLIE